MSRCETCGPARCTMSPCVARWSTRATWRRRCRPLTPCPSRSPRALVSCPSTTCRRRRDRSAPTPCSGQARRRSDACTWLLDNDVAAGPDSLGAAAGRLVPRPRAIFSRWSRSVRSWRGSPSMPRPAPRRQDLDDLFERLEASGRLVRIDPSRPATMYRGTMLSGRELDGPASDRGRRQARPRPADRARPDRARARRGRDRH